MENAFVPKLRFFQNFVVNMMAKSCISTIWNNIVSLPYHGLFDAMCEQSQVKRV
jgi:hypothetical protein